MTEDPPPPGDPVLETLLAHQQTFLRFVSRRVANREVAEDLLQEAYTRALVARHSLQDGESVVAWFYRILRNAVIDLYRRDEARHRALGAFADELTRTGTQPGGALHEAVCACVSALAEGLKPEYRVALQEVEVRGEPVAEFADRHGITPGNAAVRVHRARQALKKQLNAYCGACARHGCLDCRCRRPPAAR